MNTSTSSTPPSPDDPTDAPTDSPADGPLQPWPDQAATSPQRVWVAGDGVVRQRDTTASPSAGQHRAVRLPRGPLWWQVARERFTAWRRRTAPRVGSSLARRARSTRRWGRRFGRHTWRGSLGLPRLLWVLLLVAVFRAAPFVRSGLGSPRWADLVAEIARRVLRPLAWLIVLGVAALGVLIERLGSGLGVLGLLPLALLAVFAGGRVRYLHTDYGRTRERFGSEGWAPYWELHRAVSARAVREVALAQRPSLAVGLPTVPDRRDAGQVAARTAAARRSVLLEHMPVTECGTWLGTSAVGPWWGSEVYAAVRDVLGLIAPPQTGKTALLIHHVLDAPGAVLSTSTKVDIYLQTAVIRAHHARSGRVHLFNPDDLGGLGSTLQWDPVRGCTRFRPAASRAGLLVGGRQRQSNDDGRWDEWATEVLTGLLMLADLDGRDMHDVARWVHSPADIERGAPQALRLMTERYQGRIPEGVVDSLDQVLNTDATRTRDSVFFAMRGAVGFMSDPVIAELCTPGRDADQFDVEAFIADRGTLYLLGSEDQHSGTAPLLAAFTGHLFETAKRVAARSIPLGRLDPPLLLSLDEVALIVPVPLPDMVADSAGRLILIEWSVQSPSQLRKRWGDEGADTILNATNALMIYGGLKNKDDLDWASELCGMRYELVADAGDPEKPGRLERVPVCPPDRVRLLVQWHALLIYRAMPVTLVRITPGWKRREVRAGGMPAGASAPARWVDSPESPAPRRPAPTDAPRAGTADRVTCPGRDGPRSDSELAGSSSPRSSSRPARAAIPLPAGPSAAPEPVDARPPDQLSVGDAPEPIVADEAVLDAPATPPAAVLGGTAPGASLEPNQSGSPDDVYRLDALPPAAVTDDQHNTEQDHPEQDQPEQDHPGCGRRGERDAYRLDPGDASAGDRSEEDSAA